MGMGRWALCGCLVMGAWAWAAGPAEALVWPLRVVEGEPFAVETEGIQLVALSLELTPASATPLPDEEQGWILDMELLLRNRRGDARVQPLFLPDDAALRMEGLWVEGEVVAGDALRLRYDPRLPQVEARDGRRVTLAFADQQLRSLRVRWRASVQRSPLGELYVSVPWESLGSFFEDPIDTLTLRVEFGERVLGFQSSLSGHRFFEGQRNSARWFVRTFRPQRPWQLRWIGAWPALLLAAEVEACPMPWEVMRRLSTDGPRALDTWLRERDPDTLRFCASLPLVVRGHVFSSDQTRRALGAIPMERYLGPPQGRGPLYRPDPGFTREGLSEVERLYNSFLERAARVGEEAR